METINHTSTTFKMTPLVHSHLLLSNKHIDDIGYSKLGAGKKRARCLKKMRKFFFKGMLKEVGGVHGVGGGGVRQSDLT